MLSDSFDCVHPVDLAERAYLESLVDADYEHSHPEETLDDLKRRASFSKEDKGLLRDWMAVAAARAVAEPAMARLLIADE